MGDDCGSLYFSASCGLRIGYYPFYRYVRVDGSVKVITPFIASCEGYYRFIASCCASCSLQPLCWLASCCASCSLQPLCWYSFELVTALVLGTASCWVTALCWFTAECRYYWYVQWTTALCWDYGWVPCYIALCDGDPVCSTSTALCENCGIAGITTLLILISRTKFFKGVRM